MQNTSLKDIAKLFLRLGITAFGGPAAHIAMMRDEVVQNKKWMSDQHFLDLLGATNLIPGPNSTEMAIHIGHERGGLKGLFLAGVCFIVPAVIITGFFAWLYKTYGVLPQAQQFIYGIKPAIIAVILSAVYPMAKASLKNWQLIVIGLFALLFCFLGFNEMLVLFGSGTAALLLHRFKKTENMNGFAPLLFLQSNVWMSGTNLKLFLSFLKIGSILYGSGYVLFAFLDEELVKQGLLTKQQLMDAVAVGQFTPGPVFSAVTFIGYQMNGWSGAVVSTLGIFLPSFLLVWLLNPLVPKMRKSKQLATFLDAVNVASVALIFYVCVGMAKESISDWRTIVIAVISILVCFGFRTVNSAFVVLGGSLLGYALSFI